MGRRRVVVSGAMLISGAISMGCAGVSPSLAFIARGRVPFEVGPGPSLTGKDPFDTGCARDGETLERAFARAPNGRPSGLVELRWSPSCQTSWTRVVRFDGRTDASLVGTVSAQNGERESFRTEGGAALWTDMVFAAGACVTASATLYHDGTPIEAEAMHCPDQPPEAITAGR